MLLGLRSVSFASRTRPSAWSVSRERALLLIQRAVLTSLVGAGARGLVREDPRRDADAEQHDDRRCDCSAVPMPRASSQIATTRERRAGRHHRHAGEDRAGPTAGCGVSAFGAVARERANVTTRREREGTAA